MSEETRGPPPGSPPCPHCQQPVPIGVPYCPQCGFQLATEPRTRSSMGSGLTWMIAGLVVLGLAGFVFFASCLGAGSGNAALQLGMIAAAVLALAGIVVMGIGVVKALRDLVRR